MQLGPDRWRVSVDRPKDPLERDKAGKPKRRRYVRIVRGKRRDAIAVLDQLRDLRKQETPGSDSTIRQLAAQWFRTRTPGWSQATHDTTRSWMHHIEPLMDLPVRTLTRRHVTDWHEILRARGVGEPSIYSAHKTLVAILYQAVEWDAVERNVAARMRLPRPRGRADRPPQMDAVNSILAAAPPDIARFLEVVSITGARISEALAIRWQDVDLGARTVTIGGAMRGTSVANYHRGPTKTGKSRTVAIDDDTAAMLGELYLEHAELVNAEPDGYVFRAVADGSRPWHARTVRRRVNRLREDLGLTGEEFWIHGLRHRAATLLLRAGVSVRDAAEQLGHSPEMMLRTYAHATQQANHRAAEILRDSLR